MIISKVEVFPMSTPLVRAQTIRDRIITRIDSVVLKLTTDEGLVGYADSGDTAVRYRGETQDSIMGIIQGTFAPKVLLGEDPTKIEKIVGRMDFLVRDNFQAKALIDFAIHDLTGKIYNQPVYNILGGKSVDSVGLGFVVGVDKPELVAREAVEILKAGFQFVKLKSHGDDTKADIKMVAAVREAIGESAMLLIDSNCAWTYDQALYTIRALDKYNLYCIEQPMASWDFEGMARLRGQVGTPIFADESAQDLHDIARLINMKACDGLMIKLQKAGGILKSQRWLTMARLANMPVICGCMVGGGLEASPASHLLVSDEWISRFPQENAGPLHIYDTFSSADIKNDLARNVPKYENGTLTPNDGPGLGIDVNEELMKSRITPDKSSRVMTL